VFEHQKLASGFKHPAEFTKTENWLGHRAERADRHNRVESVVGEFELASVLFGLRGLQKREPYSQVDVM